VLGKARRNSTSCAVHRRVEMVTCGGCHVGSSSDELSEDMSGVLAVEFIRKLKRRGMCHWVTSAGHRCTRR
jgi:hypothetical protein